MRRRISIRGCVRPSVGPSVRRSVRSSVRLSRVIFRRVLGASFAVYPALFFRCLNLFFSFCQSKLKEVKPEDHSVTTMLDLVAQPEHHDKIIVCK